MLAPAQDYKDILLSKMHNFDKIALVFGTREIKLYFDKDTYYYYVSLSPSKEIVGIFGYQVLPQSSGQGYGACRFYAINFTEDHLLFAKDFYNLITQYIFHPDNNIETLRFDSFLHNPMIGTYRRFAQKYGSIVATNDMTEVYLITKQQFLAKHQERSSPDRYLASMPTSQNKKAFG